MSSKDRSRKVPYMTHDPDRNSSELPKKFVIKNKRPKSIKNM